jgi:hypothetical protein
MEMQAYLEKVLHREVQLTAYDDIAKLPLIYRSTVRLHVLNIDKQACLLIEPLETMALPDLRKCCKQTERLTGMPCALYLHTLSYYAKESLLREGIAFVWENHQLYLPFMGVLLNSCDERQLNPCSQISFMTQKLLLKALYEVWNGTTVTQAAEALGVSKMTISRCFDEIEVLELPILQVKNRARKLYAAPDKRAMWQIIQPVLRNPIIKEFRLAEIPQADLPLSGLSALAEYSMLTDNPYPTVAFEKVQIQELNPNAWKQVPQIEQPVCVAHEVGYLLPFGNHNAIDPLSAALMLTEEDKTDPRVETSLNEMLEEYVW